MRTKRQTTTHKTGRAKTSKRTIKDLAHTRGEVKGGLIVERKPKDPTGGGGGTKK